MSIVKIENNKKDYLDLLLLADPSEIMINKYLDEGEVFVLYEGTKAVSIAVVIEVEEKICELKNLATLSDYRGKGYAKQLLNFLFNYYKERYNCMLVGTTANSFYNKFGFYYTHTIKNFFVDNYPTPVIENGVQWIDMIYMKKDIKGIG